MDAAEHQTVGVVEPRVTTLTLPPGGFRLEDGGTLARIDVAWESCGLERPENDNVIFICHALDGGTLARIDVAWESCGLERPENDNVIFICHALTGDAHVAGRRPGEESSSGWWDSIVGPGKALDTNRYRVVCANVLGGCKGTTGPSSVNPATGRPYGSSFPRFTIGDTVEVYRAFLREIGVTHLAGLVGGSFGGIQVIEWITAHPGEVDKAVMIASGAALNAQALAFDIVGRYAITLDPGWQGGDYYGGPGPRMGLAQARQVAHITYLSLDLLNRRFGRKQQEDWLKRGADWLEQHAARFGTTFAIESYLEYQARKFLARFDANSYLQITHAMDGVPPHHVASPARLHFRRLALLGGAEPHDRLRHAAPGEGRRLRAPRHQGRPRWLPHAHEGARQVDGRFLRRRVAYDLPREAPRP